MISRSSRIGLFASTVLVTVGSCTTIPPDVGKSPLVRAQMSAGSCVLDILFARFPFGDEEANGSLWDEIDEQQFPCELRRQLASYGFRVGLVGGQMPLQLARMLELKDKPAPTGESNQVRLEDMESVAQVVRRHLQVPAAERREILASGVYDELPVLEHQSGSLCGRTYPKAQGLLALEAFPEPDGRVRLELVPEVHYGDMGQHFVGDQGRLRLEVRRARRAFPDLGVSATLAAGDMLILSCLPNRPGSLGHHFFTHQCAGEPEQKLLVIRLSQTQHDDLFSPDRLLAVED